MLRHSLDALTLEIVKTSAIEGESLNNEQVRSSVACHLGIDDKSMLTATREIDAVVEMMLNATYHYQQPLLLDDLLGWHRALFPDGYSALYRIKAGSMRDDSQGPMQVVSGGYGHEQTHFVASSADRLSDELDNLSWFNTLPNGQENIDLVIKAGIAHLWFVTIHPFDDGNGRLTRAITERALAQSDDSAQRFYSMSAQILKQRNDYYKILERTKKDDTDITDWLCWFLQTLEQALIAAQNNLLTDFYGKLATKKWSVMTKCSIDTALRDINDLIEKGMLKKSEASGRSTSYEVAL